jgi:hypothetical protein
MLASLGVAEKSLAYPTSPPPDPKNPLEESAYQIRVTRQVSYRGRPLSYGDQVDIDKVQITWAFELIQIPALGLVKLSFTYFYRRVFCTGTGPARIVEYVTVALIWIIVAWTTSFFFAFLFISDVNFAAWWTSIKTVKKYCGKFLELQLGYSMSDFITAVIVFVLPLPTIIW